MEYLKANRRNIFRGLFFVCVVIAMLFTSTSIWLSRTLFDQQNLGEITAKALREESSRESIATTITDKIFEDKPVLAATAGPRLSTVISGLLDTDVASNSLKTLTEKLQFAMTSEQQPLIAIQLSPIKEVVVNIQNSIGSEDREQRINVDDIPDEVVFFDGDVLPNYHNLGIAILWLGPISFVFGFGGLGWWVYKGRKNALQVRLKIAGMLSVAAGIIGLLMGPLIEPIFVSIGRNAPGQTLLGNLYNGLISPFNNLSLMLTILGVVVVGVSLTMPMMNKRRSK